MLRTVAAGATDTALTKPATGATGAVGDFLESVTIIPASTSPGAVSIKDGDGSGAGFASITLFPGGSSSVATLAPFTIQIGEKSRQGAWKVTTGSNVSVIAKGSFS